MSNTRWAERLEKMQQNIQRSQQDLELAQLEIDEKIRSLDELNVAQSDLNSEVRKLTDLLDQERVSSSKLSTDLARSLELNLKLQFEIEELRTKSNNIMGDVRKESLDLKEQVANLEEENNELITALEKFQEHVLEQKNSISQLTTTAEKKIVELKLLLDKKIVEGKDYYSHLQQSLAQNAVLRQENVALKDYATKLLHLLESQQINGKSSQTAPAPSYNTSAESAQRPATVVDSVSLC